MRTARNLVQVAVLAVTLLVVGAGCEKQQPAENGGAKSTAQGAATKESSGAAAGNTEAPAGNTEAPAGSTDNNAPAPAVAESGNGQVADDIDWAVALHDPSIATATAPETFRVELETTRGRVLLELYREWSPRGVDRLYNLVKAGYLADIAIFRAVPGFVAQFGMHGDPKVNEAWSQASIKDDPVTQSNARGTIVFAMAGPDTRSTQFFINLADNSRLDQMGFSPLGKVVEGMEVVDAWHTGYGDGPPRGQGPDQGEIAARGNDYLRAQFPKLDYIVSSRIVP